MATTISSISVRINAITSGLQKGMRKARNSVKRTAASMERSGAAMTAAISAPLAGIGALAVREFSRFEDALIEVQKVTDQTTMEELRGPIQRMSEEVPIAARELAGLAADAARFGVRGSAKIRRFTETTAQMATATDLSAQQAGEAFARLAALTSTPVEEVGNLGSAINALSNNLATSSSEIVDSMLRASAALSDLGLRNTEIAGLAGALNEVSESADRAGTRLRRLAQELLDPGKVEDLASALGMTRDEFKRIRSDAPLRLLQAMVQAFADGDAKAEALRSTLSTTSQQALSGLAQNLDGVTQSLRLSGQEYQRNESLQREFEAAVGTLSSELQLMRNTVVNAGIALGRQLAPAVRRVSEMVRSLVQRFKSLTPEARATALAIGTIATAAGPTLFIFGKILGVAASLAGAIAALPATLTAVATALGAAAATSERFRTTLVQTATELGSLVIDAFNRFGNQTLTLFQNIWRNVRDVFVAGTTIVIKTLSTFLDVLLGNWGRAGLKLQKITKNFMSVVGKIFARSFTGILKSAGELWIQLPTLTNVGGGAMVAAAEVITKQLEKRFGVDLENLVAKTDKNAKGMGDAMVDRFMSALDTMKAAWADFTRFFQGGMGAGGGSGGAGGGARGGGPSAAAVAGLGGTGSLAGMAQNLQVSQRTSDLIARNVSRANAQLGIMGNIGKDVLNNLNFGFRRVFENALGFLDVVRKLPGVFGDFASAAVSALKRVIAKLSAAAAISAVLSFVIPGGGALVGASGAGFGGIFSAITGFANGGLVMGPMLARVGEGRSTSRSNPEVIAPLDKLQRIIGARQGGTLTAEIGMERLTIQQQQGSNFFGA